MPMNDPKAYLPGGSHAGQGPAAASPPLPGGGAPAMPGGAPNGAPSPVVPPGAAPVGTLEQQVIEGYMSLTPVEKKVLLTAMDGVLGQILIKVMPDELEEVFMEAINTSPDQIGQGVAPPMAAGKYAPAAPAGPPVPPQGGPPGPPVSPQGPSTSLAGQQFRR